VIAAMSRSTCAQAVQTMLLVHVQRRRPDQCRQLACCAAPHQVHFEIALLRMHVAERTHRVDLVSSLDSDRAVGIEGDADGCRQAGQCRIAIQLRQAAAQQQPDAHCAQQHNRQQGPQAAFECLAHCHSSS